MAGTKSAAVVANWPVWEQKGAFTIADPAACAGASGVDVPIEATDPYFVWTVVNAGRRVATVRPSSPRRVNRTQAMPAPRIEECKPLQYTSPAAFLQVLIQVATDNGEDADEDKHHLDLLNNHVKESKSGLRLRGVFKDSAQRVQDRAISKGVRFVTGIVADWWLECFLKRIGNECVRWEMAHARSPIDVKPPPGHADDESDDRRSDTWDDADKLLDGDVMVIIDHGCPFANPAFRADDQTSRIRYVWFQGSDAVGDDLPRPLRFESAARLFPYGKELRGSAIDSLMRGRTEAGCYEALGYDSMREASSHGGHVMAIACGKPNPLVRHDGEDWLCGPGFWPQAVAAESDRASEAKIIFVELPRQAVGDSSGGSMNVHLIDALNYVLERTAETARITVNCSYGTHGGPHDGSSLLEGAIEDVLRRRPEGSFNLVVPIGNAFNSACHAHAAVAQDCPLRVIVDVAADKTTDTFVEVWIPRSVSAGEKKVDVEFSQFSVELTSPTGQVLRSSPGNTVACWFAPASGSSPSVTVVQSARATETRHRMLVVIAPTWQRPDRASEGLAPYGHWQVSVLRTGPGDAVPVDIWIERDDPIFEPPIDRQARFVTDKQLEPAEDFYPVSVTKASSNTSYGSSSTVLVAGGYVRPTRRDDHVTSGGTKPLLASYTSAGASQPHLAQNKPDALAAVDDSAVLLGRNAPGNLARAWVRRNGTSVAAPQLARYLVNTGALTGLLKFSPSLAGERGDGLSTRGERLQVYRCGGSLALPW